MVFALLTHLYINIFYPSVYVDYFPDEIRLAVELFVLLYLSFSLLKIEPLSIKMPTTLFIGIVIFLSIFVIISNNEARKIFSSINKLIFFLLLVRLLKNSKYLTSIITKLWLVTWCIIPITCLLTIAFFYTGLPYEKIFDADGYYMYFQYPIVGNFFIKYYDSFKLAKVSGYMVEPAILSFFFIFNIVSAHFFIRRSSRFYGVFIMLNLLAGVFTFSYGLYFISIIVITAKYFKLGKIKRPILIFTVLTLFLSVLGYIIFVKSGIGGITSYSDRKQRFISGIIMLKNNNMITWLFGNGIAYAQNEAKAGLSCGWLNLLVDRGFIVLVYMTYIVYKYTKYSIYLMSIVFFYHIFEDYFWSPIFYCALAISYAGYYHQTNVAMLEQQYEGV